MALSKYSDNGFMTGFFVAAVLFWLWYMFWVLDATHDVAMNLNQKVCMQVDDIGSKRCATDKEVLEWLRSKRDSLER